MSYDAEELSVTEVRELLREWRECNERRSEEVVELWITVLMDNQDKLGNEKFIIIDQVITASLDCHQYRVVEQCIGILVKHFPTSLRVLRYEVEYAEALQSYDQALKYIEKILKEDETNVFARKRRVAIYKAQGLLSDAVKELVEYLKKYMSDAEGWQELCELYLQLQDYTKAVFCAEELLLHQPHSHFAHQRVADIRYTMGGIENMELAKLYYCQALKLNPDNLRALLGLFLVSNHLVNHFKTSGTANKRKEAWRLNQWAQKQVTQQYRDYDASGPLSPQEDSPALDAMLLSLSIAE